MVKCDSVGCDVEQTYRVELLVWPRNSVYRPEESALRIELSLWLCEEHARTVKVADIVSDAVFEVIRQSILDGGLPEPDRISIEIVPVPCRLN